MDYDKVICVLASHLNKFPQEIREAAESGMLDYPDAKDTLRIALGIPFLGESYAAFLKKNPTKDNIRKGVFAKLKELNMRMMFEEDPEKKLAIAQEMNAVNNWEYDNG